MWLDFKGCFYGQPSAWEQGGLATRWVALKRKSPNSKTIMINRLLCSQSKSEDREREGRETGLLNFLQLFCRLCVISLRWRKHGLSKVTTSKSSTNMLQLDCYRQTKICLLQLWGRLQETCVSILSGSRLISNLCTARCTLNALRITEGHKVRVRE